MLWDPIRKLDLKSQVLQMNLDIGHPVQLVDVFLNIVDFIATKVWISDSQ